MNRCLRCMADLPPEEGIVHRRCLDAFWPINQEFTLPITIQEIEDLALDNVRNRLTIPGVQPKLSLDVPDRNISERITIVGAMEGNYILKPPHHDYPQMPEMESLCMHLILACGMVTVPFSLIPFQSGELAYITKRVDRQDGERIAMEDFCQLTERLTERKYSGSHELIAKTIRKFARNPLIEVVRFYELVLACFLMGNSDMHLKNFSLIRREKGYYLAPAYDVIASRMYIPEDREELALTLNGKKNKLIRSDFEQAMQRGGLPMPAISNLFQRIYQGVKKWPDIIQESFLSPEMKNGLLSQVERTVRIMFDI